MKKYLEEMYELIRLIQSDNNINLSITNAISETILCLKNNRKLLIAGNGGSASQAQHFSGEIVGRYKKERKGYAAIALTADSSILTAWSNDYSFDTVFSRQIEALGKKGDIFFGLSTSGNSKNIIEAVKQAKDQTIKTICLLGNDGGKLKNLCDIPIVIPSNNTPRIQEIHLFLIHCLCEELEKSLP